MKAKAKHNDAREYARRRGIAREFDEFVKAPVEYMDMLEAGIRRAGDTGDRDAETVREEYVVAVLAYICKAGLMEL